LARHQARRRDRDDVSDAAAGIAALRGHKVALVVAAALLVKAVVLVQLWNHPLLQPHGELDTAYYVTLSQRIAAEGVLAPIGAFVVSPLYVYFLAAVFAAGGCIVRDAACRSLQVSGSAHMN
jgi:hypothetical protein